MKQVQNNETYCQVKMCNNSTAFALSEWLSQPKQNGDYGFKT